LVRAFVSKAKCQYSGAPPHGDVRKADDVNTR
jgi:hypothetical protein